MGRDLFRLTERSLLSLCPSKTRFRISHDTEQKCTSFDYSSDNKLCNITRHMDYLWIWNLDLLTLFYIENTRGEVEDIVHLLSTLCLGSIYIPRKEHQRRSRAISVYIRWDRSGHVYMSWLSGEAYPRSPSWHPISWSATRKLKVHERERKGIT